MREAIIMRARYRTVDDLVAETHDNFEQLGQRDSRVSSDLKPYISQNDIDRIPPDFIKVQYVTMTCKLC